VQAHAGGADRVLEGSLLEHARVMRALVGRSRD
jgi:hypothetical protein